MLFALLRLFILSLCISSIRGNDVTERSAEGSTISHSSSPTLRPLPHRNQTKTSRNDQLLSLLATRRRQIIENRFKNHIRTLVELSKNRSSLILPKKPDHQNATTVNIHLKLSDLLNNSVNNTSEEQPSTPSPEINIVNVSSPRNLYRKNVYGSREPPQIQENKNAKNMPIIRNILFRRKMSFMNRKLPLDFDQISYDTLGLSEIRKNGDDLLFDAEDSLQVEESSHDKLIYYDVKNNSSKNSMNNFEDVSEETKAVAMKNKTHHPNKALFENDSKEVSEAVDDKSDKNETKSRETNVNDSQNNTHSKNPEQNKTILKTRHKENKTETKSPKNNTHFMPQSLYNYFRPPENVPEEEMQPFLHFGDKIPVTKQNTTKNQSFKPIQLIPKAKIYNEDNVTHKHEDEVDENMDVSVTKSIYENKIPKVILPNPKVTVVQQYMKNRSYNLTKPETRNYTKSEKKSNTIVIPPLRGISRNRGFRNRTIFFHQKRNGLRQTINLRPNSTIADLKPTQNASDEHSETDTNLNKTTTEKNVGFINDSPAKESQTEVALKVKEFTESENMTNSTIFDVTRFIETSTKHLEFDKSTVTEFITETDKIPKSTEKMSKIIETTTQLTTAKKISATTTTVIIPTTRILSTDVVTSISIKSSFSELSNKTKDLPINLSAKNKTETKKINITDLNDPEATVIAQLNNFTSQTFTNNITKISYKNVSAILNSKLNLTTSKVLKQTDEIGKSTPMFYLNKTDFIIHVPDVEMTTNIASGNTEIELTQNTDFETTTNHQIIQDVQINVRANLEDVTEKEIGNTVTSTSRSKIPENVTVKFIGYADEIRNGTTKQPAILTDLYQTKKLPSVTEKSKKTLNVFNSTVISNADSASELPLATLFNVIDLKKTDTSRNTTAAPKVITGTETVISRKKDNNSTFDNIHAAYILASLGLIPMTVIIIYVIRNLMQRKNKCFEDFEAELQDDKANIITPVARLPALVVDSATKWEFPRSKLRLQTLLGQGNFGQVWKAEADDLKGHIGLTRLVAVKTIKDGAGNKERDDLLKELAIMQKMGSHPNVVTLLGCCTEKEPYLLIMEYVMYGKLLTYLRDHRTRQDYFNFSDDAATLTARDLTVFAYCVARGMEYLGTKGIIHRDLAARNILVDHNKLCKIADFGMSRDLNGDQEITEPRQARNALPVRWMAIESLLYSVFTYKTDVWSFGVLLWEIVTLGSSPYANMSGREVMRLICDGYRLERPNHCKPELYNVMARTWYEDSDQRPTFTELRTELAEMLENTAAEGSYVDLESFRADSTVYEIDNCTPRGNYFTVKNRFSEFECDI